MKRQQSGLTLIELVMVIVLLGILASFTLPKFADLSQDVNVSSIEGARDAVISASAIAHAAYLGGGSANPVDLEGSYTLTLGYPDATQIESIADLDGYLLTMNAGGTVLTVGLNSGSCSFTYTEALNATTPPAVSPRIGADCQ